MTLTDKQNETLARLGGWAILRHENGDPFQEAGDDGAVHWYRRRKQYGYEYSVGCPDMATPDAMVELMEFCQERGKYISVGTNDIGSWGSFLQQHDVEEVHPIVGIGDTPGEAVARAVLALKDGGSLLTDPADFPEHLRLRQLPWKEG